MDKKKRLLLIIALALILVLVLAVVLAVVLRRAPGEEQREKLPQVGLCLRQYEADPQYGQILETTLTAAGFDVTVLDAKDDQSRQTEQIRDLLNEGIQLLVIEPVIADAADDTVSLLMEKNVPAVFIGNRPETALEKWSRISFVGNDETGIGSLQGQIILQLEDRGDLNGDGQVSCLVISGPEDDARAKLQAEGCIDALVGEGLIIDQIDTSWGEWTAESGRIRCAKALSQYGKDIEVIFCGNEEITLGALEAVETGGWQIGRDYCLVGVGAEENLQTDHMTGTVAYDLETAAQQVLSVAQALIKAEAVEQEYYVSPKTMTEETLSEQA